MTKTRTLVIGMLVLTLLAFGIVALAGNGFGRGAASDKPGAGVCMQERDSDGIPNCDDPDWTRSLDGTGYGAMNCSHDGARHGQGNGPHDGSGYEQGNCQRDGNGGGRGMHRGYGNGARMGVGSE